MVALIGTLFLDVQRKNAEVERRCYDAYAILEEKYDKSIDSSSAINYTKLENYLSVIKQDKERYEADLYYGAFGVRNSLAEYITNVVSEFYKRK